MLTFLPILYALKKDWHEKQLSIHLEKLSGIIRIKNKSNFCYTYGKACNVKVLKLIRMIFNKPSLT